ncbi:MAG: hypothetical protein K2N66_05690, partial [Paramuribaculum sp.]|nr:hypothetical protein [Paramuribaculum sp.]
MTLTIIAALAVALTASIAATVWMWSANRRKDANLRLLLEALGNDDTTLRFSNSRSINDTLNR